MKSLGYILEHIEDGHEVVITFVWGDIMGLKDCEMVDESIYDRADLCVADIVSPIKCDQKLWRKEGKIEFSLTEVARVEDPANHTVIYETAAKLA